MPTINIEGRRVKVDDSFLQLSPEDQAKTVDEIAHQIGIAPGAQAEQPQQAQPVSGRHLSYEEGAALLDADSTTGKVIAGGGGALDQIPVVGPYLTSAAKAGGAALGSLVTGKSYDDARAETERNYNAAMEANPKTAIAGRVVGAVAPMVGVGATALGGRLLGNAGSLATRAAFGAGSGAVIGGADTAARGGSAMDVAKSTGMGAFLGGALPVAAAGVGRAYGAARNALSARRAAEAAGTTPEVLAMLKDTLEADGTLGPVGRANMAAAGKDAMLADAGPNAKSILDAAIQRGGPGAVSARDAIERRVAGGSQDLVNVLDTTLGQAQGISSARAAIKTSTAGARSAAYDAAYSTPIDYAHPKARLLEELIKRRVPSSAIAKANKLMRLNGEQSKQILAKVAEDGSIRFERLPDVRQIDYITEALKDMADVSDGAGKLGGQTRVGAAYNGLASTIRRVTGELVPEYRNALDTAGDAIGRSKAVQLGGKVFSASVPADDVKIALSSMSDAEKEAVAQGIRSRIDNVMSSVTRTVQDGNTDAREAIKALKDLSSRASREKVALVIGPEKAKTLFSELDRISKSFDLRASVAENSKTFARQAVSGKVDKMTEPGMIGQALQGEPIKAGKRVVQEVTQMTPDKIQARKDQVWSQLADFLTRSPDRSRRAFDAMEQIGVQQGLNRQEAQKLAARALAVSSRLTYPANVLLTGRPQSQASTR